MTTRRQRPPPPTCRNCSHGLFRWVGRKWICCVCAVEFGITTDKRTHYWSVEIHPQTGEIFPVLRKKDEPQAQKKKRRKARKG